jgi:general secretion pathway protein F
MARFRYKAVNPSGKVVEGEMDAADRASVIIQLQTQGDLPISAEAGRASFDLAGLVHRLRGVRSAPRAADVTSFTRELATLLAAGIPLDGSLRLLLRHSEHGRMHALIKQVQRDVQAGKSLSSALAIHADTFDSLYVGLIRAGESSGALDTVLARLAAHRDKSQVFRASLTSALAYPAILAVVASISLFVLMSFVVPRFIPLFSEAEETLPMLTQVIFSVSQVFAGFWWVAAASVLVGKLALDRWLAVSTNRLSAARRLLSLPVLGPLIQQADTVRFCRTLSMLLRNGLPLLSSLKLSRDAVRNEAIAAAVMRCVVQVQSGRRLSQALREESLLPTLAIELVTIGEESGTVEEMLERVADTFETRVEQRLKRLLTLLEPVLILGLGALIGIVIVAILMAMLGLNELVT